MMSAMEKQRPEEPEEGGLGGPITSKVLTHFC